MATMKENVFPVSAKKSKLPVPVMSSSKKGTKRAISPNFSSSEAKRSPVCTRSNLRSSTKKSVSFKPETCSQSNTAASKRSILGELPQEQRKIMKVRRALTSTKENVPSKSTTVSKPMKRNTKKPAARKQNKIFPDTDQSDIMFEADESALQSILTETGIQYGETQSSTSLTRHTLAALPKPQRVSCVKKVEALCHEFDNFISRNARKEPPAKRQCREPQSATAGDRFNLNLTPSKTDFCARYGVEQSTVFTGATPESGARQSLPGRSKGRPIDPFVFQSRPSMISRTPRLGTLDENPGRVSLTPMRVPRQEPNLNNENNPGIQPFSAAVSVGPITPGRFSLAASSSTRPGFEVQAPARVSLYEGRSSLQSTALAPGRISLAGQRTLPNGADEFDSHTAPTPRRVSLAAQRTLPQGDDFDIHTAPTPKRVSLAAHRTLSKDDDFDRHTAPTPRRVSLAAQRTVSQSTDEFDNKYKSLDMCTPGRVSLSGARLNLGANRLGLINQTPSQVKNVNIDIPSTENVSNSDSTNISRKSEDSTGNEESVLSDDVGVAKKSWHDILLSESKTNLKSTTVTASTMSTPQRVKPLIGDDSKNGVCTPKRTLSQTNAGTPRMTPMRVLKTNSKIECFSPPVREQRQPELVMRTPLRVFQNKERPTLQMTPPQRVPAPVSTITPKRVPVSTPLRTPTIKKESATPSPQGEGKCNKEGESKKQSDCIDLRTIWKTKKTPIKSPIMKEVATEERTDDDNTSPTMTSLGTPCAVLNSVRRKKKITWAVEVQNRTIEDISMEKTEDDLSDDSIIPQSPCDVMQQGNPHYEQSTATPAEKSQNASVTGSTSTCDNMQLPVTGTSVQQSENTTGSLEIGTSPKNDDSCLKVNESIVSHASRVLQLTADSQLVSQTELGQHDGNVLANTMRDEFLQKQIQVFQEKKRQKQKLINQQILKGSQLSETEKFESFEHGGKAIRELDNVAPISVGPCKGLVKGLENVSECEALLTYENSFKKLDNQNVDKDDFVMCSSENNNGYTSQGSIASSDVNLDMNSNITVSNAVNVNVHQCENNNTTSSSRTACTPTRHIAQPEIQTDEQKAIITPFNVKTKRFVSTPRNDDDDNSNHGTDRNSQNTQESFDNKSGQQGETHAPIWTPLAMKSVAMRQNLSSKNDNSIIKFNDESMLHDKSNNTAIFDANSVCCENSMTNVAETTNEKIQTVENTDTKVTDKDTSCGLVLNEALDQSRNANTSHRYPQTPPNRKSAFRSLGKKSGLSPVVGSLSLRANSTTKREKSSLKCGDSLQKCVMKIANERYLEALLDDEVELFMCRLSPSISLCKGREYCYNPVSITLLYGDEMHFIPVESCDSIGHTGDLIEGSAFSKYADRMT